MRSRIRGTMRWSDAAARVVSLVLLVLITAHIAHLPVLAFEDHADVTEPASVQQEDGPAAKNWPRTLHAPSSEHGDGEAHLVGHGDRDAECMTVAATMSTRAATPEALKLPAGIPNVAEANSFAPATAVIYPTEFTRRHLLLQVLLL